MKKRLISVLLGCSMILSCTGCSSDEVATAIEKVAEVAENVSDDIDESEVSTNESTDSTTFEEALLDAYIDYNLSTQEEESGLPFGSDVMKASSIGLSSGVPSYTKSDLVNGVYTRRGVQFLNNFYSIKSGYDKPNTLVNEDYDLFGYYDGGEAYGILEFNAEFGYPKYGSDVYESETGASYVMDYNGWSVASCGTEIGFFYTWKDADVIDGWEFRFFLKIPDELVTTGYDEEDLITTFIDDVAIVTDLDSLYKRAVYFAYPDSIDIMGDGSLMLKVAQQYDEDKDYYNFVTALTEDYERDYEEDTAYISMDIAVASTSGIITTLKVTKYFADNQDIIDDYFHDANRYSDYYTFGTGSFSNGVNFDYCWNSRSDVGYYLLIHSGDGSIVTIYVKNQNVTDDVYGSVEDFVAFLEEHLIVVN